MAYGYSGKTTSARAPQSRQRDVHHARRARATPLPRPIASATTEGVNQNLNLFRLGDDSPPCRLSWAKHHLDGASGKLAGQRDQVPGPHSWAGHKGVAGPLAPPDLVQPVR